MSDSYNRLVEPWVLTVTVNEQAQARQFPPLLDMLQDHITPDTGKTMGGANDPSARNVLDTKSLDMLIHIQDVTRAWLQEWGRPSPGDVKDNMRAFWNHLHALHATVDIDPIMFDHLASYADTWATSIWDLIEPPLRVTLRGSECPKCERAKISTNDGETADNLLLIWRDHQEPTAECQWVDCGAIWVGESGLVELGRALNVEIDLEGMAEARHARVSGV